MAQVDTQLVILLPQTCSCWNNRCCRLSWLPALPLSAVCLLWALQMCAVTAGFRLSGATLPSLSSPFRAGKVFCGLEERKRKCINWKNSFTFVLSESHSCTSTLPLDNLLAVSVDHNSISVPPSSSCLLRDRYSL